MLGVNMFRQIKTLSVLLLTFVLQGCVPHMTQEECQQTDWYHIGSRDGSEGRDPRDLQPAIQNCAKFKLSVNIKRYQEGWRNGTQVYCQPDNGYRLGTQGQYYGNVCPSDLRPAFQQAWHKGLRAYCIPQTGYNLGRSGRNLPTFCAPDLVVAFQNAYDSGRRLYQAVASVHTQINRVNLDITTVRRKINRKERKIQQWRDRLTSSSITPPLTLAEKRRLRGQIYDEQRTLPLLHHKTLQLEAERSRLQQQVNELQARH